MQTIIYCICGADCIQSGNNEDLYRSKCRQKPSSVPFDDVTGNKILWTPPPKKRRRAEKELEKWKTQVLKIWTIKSNALSQISRHKSSTMHMIKIECGLTPRRGSVHAEISLLAIVANADKWYGKELIAVQSAITHVTEPCWESFT